MQCRDFSFLFSFVAFSFLQFSHYSHSSFLQFLQFLYPFTSANIRLATCSPGWMWALVWGEKKSPLTPPPCDIQHWPPSAKPIVHFLILKSRDTRKECFLPWSNGLGSDLHRTFRNNTVLQSGLAQFLNYLLLEKILAGHQNSQAVVSSAFDTSSSGCSEELILICCIHP